LTPILPIVRGGRAVGIGGGQQVGSVQVYGYYHASLWNGTSESWMDLHSPLFQHTAAFDTDGLTQVGQGTPYVNGFMVSHALLWRGSANTVVDLHPPGASSSRANGVSGSTQVGYIALPNAQHAVLWRGSAESMVDLHAFLPKEYVYSEATDIAPDGTVVGVAQKATAGPHAFIWRPVTP
jgi:probable HAF family extracellular repeat protein